MVIDFTNINFNPGQGISKKTIRITDFTVSSDGVISWSNSEDEPVKYEVTTNYGETIITSTPELEIDTAKLYLEYKIKVKSRGYRGSSTFEVLNPAYDGIGYMVIGSTFVIGEDTIPLSGIGKDMIDVTFLIY